MRALLFLMITAISGAAADKNAYKLLQQVQAHAQSLTSWQATGRIAIESSDPSAVPDPPEQSFSAAVQKPAYARVDIIARTKISTICDGTAAWTWVPSIHQYSKAGASASMLCAAPSNPSEHLLDYLDSAVRQGTDTIEFNGAPVTCEMVRAEYTTVAPSIIQPMAMQRPLGPVTRTLCIGRDRLLVLRDRLEQGAKNGPRTVAIITYSGIEENAKLAADAFRFDPPPDSIAAGGELSAGGSYRIGDNGHNGVAPPKVIHHVPPIYPQSGFITGVHGTVGLSVTIDENGMPRDPTVVLSLRPDFDKAAVEALRKWRFRPAMKDGHPVAVTIQIDISFQAGDHQ